MNHAGDSSGGNWSFSELQRIDALCDEFERVWNVGGCLAIEQLLSQNASLPRAELLDQLLRLELHLRRAAGDSPSLEEYQRRFPADEKIVARVCRECPAERESGDLPSTANFPEKLRSPAPLPDRIGRFLIRRFLGRGGFGAVYLAHDPDAGCDVALKIPHPEVVESARRLEDFLQEARTGEHLDHPHLVRTLSIANEGEGSRLVIVQQFIDGESLTGWSTRTRPTPEQIVRLLIPVAQALGYLHEKGFVHRDLKPGNILVDKSDKAYVADFGLALHESRQRNRDRRSELAGTYAYMAPEQVRRQTQLIDGQSDLWSFGVILYRLLTDRFPFGGPPPRNQADESEYIRDLEFEIEEHDPRPPRQINPAVTRTLEKICLTCLEKRKRDRYQTGHDLADDLQQVLERSKCYVPEPSKDRKLGIVPKGLRSFDAADAPFFLELLAGPRTLDGIPTSVNFWKTRLCDTGGDGPIDVGVVYGPSGCGKSSLVKAGLLPLLGDKVVPVVVETTPEDTEVRLLKALRNALPSLPHDASVIDACRWVSERGAGSGRKILLVFDQFEQWLHAHPSPAEHQFLAALRNCNGTRLQALLLVRDDFWTPLTRFMHQLEIPLQEDINTKVVDLFSCEHARMVLLGFGRAFGRLPASDLELTMAQHQFLTSAVDGLSDGDRVICVRLALFAEMMKDRSWLPDELAKVGGAQGVGVAFLNEKFGPKAPAVYKPHRAAVRKILDALLPPYGGNLKGQMKTVAELQEAAGSASGTGFEQLLRILDTDLKLLTPVVPDQPSGMAAVANIAAESLHFQLAHDYLVPAIRSWLSAEERSTPEGRARVQLRELAQAWNDKPEPRRLPTFGEWLAIHRFTRIRDWTDPEQRMMRATNRRVVRRGMAVSVVILCAIAGGELLRQSLVNDREGLAAANLEARILEAPPQQVLQIRNENQLLSRKLSGEMSRRLRELLGRPDLKSKDHLRAALCLADSDPVQAEFLSQHLLLATPDEVDAILSLPAAHFAAFIPRYWEVLDDTAQPPGRRFRAGCALIRWAPEDSRWPARVGDFVAMLVSESPAHVTQWAASLGRAGSLLIPPLHTEFQRHEQPDKALVAAMFLSLYLQDRCDDLVELALSAQPRQLPILVSALEYHGTAASQSLKSKLADSFPDASSIEREKLARQQVNAALCLLLLGAADDVWPLLRHSEDSRVRSYLIQWAGSTGVALDRLTKRLHIETRPSIRQALILMIGEYGQDRLSGSWRLKEDAFLKQTFRNDPDAGVHFALEWLFQKWGNLEQVEAANDDMLNRISPARDWFVNSQGQALAILRLRANENAEPRRVAFSARKVTVEQFNQEGTSPSQSKVGGLPANAVSLVNAALHCNWLSEQDCIPKEEWVYLESDTVPIQMADNFANKKGYRLPTVTEWNEACMGGAKTSRPFGETDELLPFYAWYAANSHGQLKRNGLLKPNRFGLFDMLGNLTELVHPDELLPRSQQAKFGCLGGMAFGQAPAPSVINAQQKFYADGNVNHGFRVVRTLD